MLYKHLFQSKCMLFEPQFEARAAGPVPIQFFCVHSTSHTLSLASPRANTRFIPCHLSTQQLIKAIGPLQKTKLSTACTAKSVHAGLKSPNTYLDVPTTLSKITGTREFPEILKLMPTLADCSPLPQFVGSTKTSTRW